MDLVPGPSGQCLPSTDPSCGWCSIPSSSCTGRPATSCGRCTGPAVRPTRSAPMPGGWRASWAGARARGWSGPRSAWRALARFKHFVEATPDRGGRLRSGATVNATLTAVCEFLRFCARTGVIEQAVAERLSEPRWLRFIPPGFDAGESGQFRMVRARALKARAETPFPEALTAEQAGRGAGVLPPAAGTLHGDAAVGLRACGSGRRSGCAGLTCTCCRIRARWAAPCVGAHVHVRHRANPNGALAKSPFPADRAGQRRGARRLTPTTSTSGPGSLGEDGTATWCWSTSTTSRSARR